MTQQVVVKKSFLNFVRGDIVGDTEKVGNILFSEYKKFVTKITSPVASKG